MRICPETKPHEVRKECFDIPDLIRTRWPFEDPEPPWGKAIPAVFAGPVPNPWRELAVLATIDVLIPQIKHKAFRMTLERSLADGLQVLETEFTDIRIEADNAKGKARQ